MSDGHGQIETDFGNFGFVEKRNWNHQNRFLFHDARGGLLFSS